MAERTNDAHLIYKTPEPAEEDPLERWRRQRPEPKPRERRLDTAPVDWATYVQGLAQLRSNVLAAALGELLDKIDEQAERIDAQIKCIDELTKCIGLETAQSIKAEVHIIAPRRLALESAAAFERADAALDKELRRTDR